MKSSIKHIIPVMIALITLASCDRFNPEDLIIKDIDLPQCLKPVAVKTTVEYNKVTLDLKVFPDAEKYIFEIYKSAVDENTDPNPDDFVKSYEIDPADIPYTFNTLEDLTLYYRVRAVNETKMKTPSYWEVGRFRTDVDPTTICLTLEPELRECFEIVQFNWQKAVTDKYLLEVYTSAIPSSGEPDPANLYESVNLTNNDLPYKGNYPADGNTYYHRAKAIDLAGERKDSKWTKGSFKPAVFTYPNSELAIDYGLTAPFVDSYAAPHDSNIRNLFDPANTGGYTKNICGEIIYNKIHYMDAVQFCNDRVSTSGSGKYTDEAEYGVSLPKDNRHVYFLVNKPGQISVCLRKNDDEANSRGTIALLTTKKGFGSTAIYLLDTPDIVKSKGDPFIVNVTAEQLYGITEPAKIYVFNSIKTKGVHMYPITWTPAELITE